MDTDGLDMDVVRPADEDDGVEGVLDAGGVSQPVNNRYTIILEDMQANALHRWEEKMIPTRLTLSACRTSILMML